MADQFLEMLVVKIKSLAGKALDDVVDDGGISARRRRTPAASYIVTPAKQNASAKTDEEKPS